MIKLFFIKNKNKLQTTSEIKKKYHNYNIKITKKKLTIKTNNLPFQRIFYILSIKFHKV
jgi:hypothetical protein